MNILDRIYKAPVRYSLAIILLVTVLWICLCYLFSHIERFYLIHWTFGHLRNLESSFAPASSYFSAIAFAGVLVTLFLQKKTISDTSESNQLQSFETILFQLIQIHIQNQNEITFGLRGSPRDRRFLDAYNHLKMLYRYQSKDIEDIDDLISFQKIRQQKSIEKQKENRQLAINQHSERISNEPKSRPKAPSGNIRLLENLKKEIEQNNCEPQLNYYRAFFKTHKGSSTRYFRHFYHMLKHIDKNINTGLIKEKDGKHYCNIVKAQLSPFEHVCLFYHCLFFDAVLKKASYKKLLTKFSLFDDLDPTLLFDFKIPSGKIEKKAFGNDAENFKPYFME